MSANRLSVISRTWFYVAALLVVLVVWGVNSYVNRWALPQGTVLSQAAGTPGTAAPPSDWLKMMVSAMTEANRLLITLGTAMLGALGLLLGNKAAQGSPSRHLWAAALAGACGGLSLYFGYVSHLNVLSLINLQEANPNPFAPPYLFSSHMQFYTLLAGAFFLADFAVHDMSGEKRTGGKP